MTRDGADFYVHNHVLTFKQTLNFVPRKTLTSLSEATPDINEEIQRFPKGIESITCVSATVLYQLGCEGS